MTVATESRHRQEWRTVRFEVLERTAGIDDVFNDEHVTSFNIAADVHNKANCATLHVTRLVARYSNELDRAGNSQSSRQVSKKDEGTFQYAD